MSRYIALSIGCIECNFDTGASHPVVIADGDDLAEMESIVRGNPVGSSNDTVLLDTETFLFGRVQGYPAEFRWYDASWSDPVDTEANK